MQAQVAATTKENAAHIVFASLCAVLFAYASIRSFGLGIKEGCAIAAFIFFFGASTISLVDMFKGIRLSIANLCICALPASLLVIAFLHS